jgi:ribosomal small subunit protein bTHX
MGKGDQKTRRGKIQVGSFGVVRPRKKASAKTTAPKVKVEKAAPAKKAAAKKATKKEA